MKKSSEKYFHFKSSNENLKSKNEMKISNQKDKSKFIKINLDNE